MKAITSSQVANGWGGCSALRVKHLRYSLRIVALFNCVCVCVHEKGLWSYVSRRADDIEQLLRLHKQKENIIEKVLLDKHLLLEEN